MSGEDNIEVKSSSNESTVTEKYEEPSWYMQSKHAVIPLRNNHNEKSIGKIKQNSSYKNESNGTICDKTILRKRKMHQVCQEVKHNEKKLLFAQILQNNMKNNDELRLLQNEFSSAIYTPSSSSLNTIHSAVLKESDSIRCVINSQIPGSSAGANRDSGSSNRSSKYSRGSQFSDRGSQGYSDRPSKQSGSTSDKPIWKNWKVVGLCIFIMVIVIVSTTVGSTAGGSSISPQQPQNLYGYGSQQKPAKQPVDLSEYVTTPSPFNDSYWSSVRGDCGVSRVKQELIASRIVGGTEAKPHSWPWQISIVQYRRFSSGYSKLSIHCGGTLISPDIVLSATHCFIANSQFLKDFSRLRIVVGAHRLAAEGGAELTEIEQVYHHPDNNQQTYVFSRALPINDVSIIKLRRSFNPENLVPAIGFACLPKPNVLPMIGKRCWATGWGETRSTGYEGLLKQVPLDILSQPLCRKHFRKITYDTHLCANQKNMNSCQGDSGGPLVCQGLDKKWTIYGATSFGSRTCLTGPAVHSSISMAMDWICCTVPDVGPCREIGCTRS